MRETWLDPIRYRDVEKLVNIRCKKPEHLTVLFSAKKEGDKKYNVSYRHSGVRHETEIGEFGEMYTLNPFDNEDFFKMARKKNEGKKINGETFERAFIRTYEEAIFDYRDKLFDLAKAETDEKEQTNKIHQAEDVYVLLMDRLEKFVEKNKIEHLDDEDLDL